MLVVRYQDEKKIFYSQPCTKRILLTLESEVTVMPESLKLFTTIIKKWVGWKMMQWLEITLVYSKVGKKKTTKFMLFKLEIIREMLEDAHQISADSEFDCLKGRHFLSVIPSSHSKEKPQKRCVVCYKNKFRKESRYHCENCQDHPAFRIVPCTMFHDISHSDWL